MRDSEPIKNYIVLQARSAHPRKNVDGYFACMHAVHDIWLGDGGGDNGDDDDDEDNGSWSDLCMYVCMYANIFIYNMSVRMHAWCPSSSLASGFKSGFRPMYHQLKLE